MKEKNTDSSSSKKLPIEAGCLSKGSVIIYVWRQKDTEIVAEQLNGAGIGGGVVCYHGGMDAGSRSRAQSKVSSQRTVLNCHQTDVNSRFLLSSVLAWESANMCCHCRLWFGNQQTRHNGCDSSVPPSKPRALPARNWTSGQRWTAGKSDCPAASR